MVRLHPLEKVPVAVVKSVTSKLCSSHQHVTLTDRGLRGGFIDGLIEKFGGNASTSRWFTVSSGGLRYALSVSTRSVVGDTCKPPQCKATDAGLAKEGRSA